MHLVQLVLTDFGVKFSYTTLENAVLTNIMTIKLDTFNVFDRSMETTSFSENTLDNYISMTTDKSDQEFSKTNFSKI